MTDSNTYGKGQNPNSLANLNPKARYQGKKRHNVTLLPETYMWLKQSGNISQKIDELVAEAMKSDDTHNLNNSDNTVYQENEQLKRQVAALQDRVDELEDGIATIAENSHLNKKGYKRNSFSQGLKDLDWLLASG